MNVQQTIIKGIKEQLFFHDYLVLPGFGGFVLKSNGAHFSGTGLILPRSKTVSFNIQLKQNDGILAFWLQDQLQCSAAIALTHLNEFAEFCLSILNTKRRLTLDGIGFLYLDFENNICFEPRHDANFLSDSFGLAPLSVKEIELEKTILKKEPVFEDRKIAGPEIKQAVKTRTNYRRMLAPLAVLSLLFSLLALFVSNSHMSGQFRASVFSNYSPGSYQPVAYADLNLIPMDTKPAVYVADANGVAFMELNHEKSIAVKALEVPDHTKALKHSNPAVKLLNNQSGYAIVLGCFGVLDNARRMAASLSKQNIHVFISEKNEKGLYVVSNGNYLSKNEAVVKLEQVQRNFPKAWIKNP